MITQNNQTNIQTQINEHTKKTQKNTQKTQKNTQNNQTNTQK